jgi:hypothetical protein
MSHAGFPSTMPFAALICHSHSPVSHPPGITICPMRFIDTISHKMALHDFAKRSHFLDITITESMDYRSLNEAIFFAKRTPSGPHFCLD